MPARTELPILLRYDEAIADLPALLQARQDARSLTSRLSDPVSGMVPAEDASVVMFGSLTRDEFTSGSDTDWKLLVDAQAASTHLTIAQKVQRRLEELGCRPSAAATFQQARAIGKESEQLLGRVFFEPNGSQIPELTRTYGVF
ncbi:MAG: uncharacterized protein JWM27_4266 [Gemmatimonadetes bacterium]|nr:uncharacterized protein [Gemmatimonadota bacterium]